VVDAAVYRERRVWLLTALEREALPTTVVAVSVALLALLLPLLVGQDSWLAFVDGRLIAQHWLPHADTLTSWTLGRPWVDQQWAAHLMLYELAARGGIAAAVGFVLACVTVALVVCGAASRLLGASARSTAIALLLPVIAVPWLAQVRSQTLALVPFVALYALLAFDARRPGFRVLWVLPVIALWANLHGSVALGAGFVVLHGLGLLRRPASRRRGAMLVTGAPLCMFASPYEFGLAHYYRLMLVHPPLADYVGEWQPTTFGATTFVFFASAFVGIALWWRHGRRITTFERIALPILLLAALQASRSAVWFELALAITLPRLLDAQWPAATVTTAAVRRVNVITALVALGAAVIACTVQLARVDGALRQTYSSADAVAVAAAAGAHGVVLADDRHADWLLWEQPSLAGRVAYDIRFELLHDRELRQIVHLRRGLGSAWARCGATATVVTFADADDHRIIEREHVLAPGARTLVARSGFAAVAQTPAARDGC
jgi:hypothetical protein